MSHARYLKIYTEEQLKIYVISHQVDHKFFIAVTMPEFGIFDEVDSELHQAQRADILQ